MVFLTIFPSLDIYHERHGDTSAARPFRIGRIAALAAEITGVWGGIVHVCTN